MRKVCKVKPIVPKLQLHRTETISPKIKGLSASDVDIPKSPRLLKSFSDPAQFYVPFSNMQFDIEAETLELTDDDWHL